MKRPKKDNRVYLQDILAAIKRMEAYLQKGKSEFLQNELLQDAIIRQISVVGEATTKIPAEWKDEHPHIPWKSITAMRNILIHEYSDVSMERVWTVAVQDLPILQKTVQKMYDQRQ